MPKINFPTLKHGGGFGGGGGAWSGRELTWNKGVDGIIFRAEAVGDIRLSFQGGCKNTGQEPRTGLPVREFMLSNNFKQSQTKNKQKQVKFSTKLQP